MHGFYWSMIPKDRDKKRERGGWGGWRGYHSKKWAGWSKYCFSVGSLMSKSCPICSLFEWCTFLIKGAFNGRPTGVIMFSWKMVMLFLDIVFWQQLDDWQLELLFGLLGPYAICLVDGGDAVWWSKNNSGIFSVTVKSYYEVLLGHRGFPWRAVRGTRTPSNILFHFGLVCCSWQNTYHW